MKYLKLSFFLILVFSATSYADFSGRYLWIRKSGVTYGHRLYTSASNIPTAKKIGVCASPYGTPTTYYAAISAAATGANLKVRAVGATHGVQITSYWASDSTSYSFGGAAPYFDVNSGGNAYVSVPSQNKILVFDSNLDYSTQWNLGYSPGFIVIDASDNVYVEVPSGNVVYKYNSAGTYQTNYSISVFDYPIFKNGYFYYRGSGGLVKANSSLSTVSTATSCGSGYAFSVDASDNVFWIDGNYIKKTSWAGSLLYTSTSSSVGWKSLDLVGGEVLADRSSGNYDAQIFDLSLNSIGGKWGNDGAYPYLRVLYKNGKVYWLTESTLYVCEGFS